MTDVTAKSAVTAPVPADVGKGDEYVAGECGKGGRHNPGIVLART
jgi:hypothetical protein